MAGKAGKGNNEFTLNMRNDFNIEASLIIGNQVGSRTARISVTLTGLLHPLYEFSRYYMGEESKNPQHKAASDRVDRIFHQWFNNMDRKLQAKFKYQPMDSVGMDMKKAQIQTVRVLSFFGGDRRALTPAFNQLISALKEQKPAIEQDLINDEAITLTDPNQAIALAYTKACTSMSHPNI